MTDKKKVWISAGCVIIGLAVLGGIDASRLRTESFETVKEAEEHVFTVEPTITISAQEKPVTRQIEPPAKQMPIRKPTQRPYPDFDIPHLSIIKQEEDQYDSSRVESIGERSDDVAGNEGLEFADGDTDEADSGSEPVDDSNGGSVVEDEGAGAGTGSDEESVSELVEPVSNGTELEGSMDEYAEDTEEGSTTYAIRSGDGGGDTEDSESVWSEAGGLIYLGDWTTTAYCPCEICCGIYASGYTASGTLATEGRTVACGSLPFGTQVMIDGNIYTVEDTGVEGEWIDIFFYSHDQASAYGMQTKEVYLVE